MPLFCIHCYSLFIFPSGQNQVQRDGILLSPYVKFSRRLTVSFGGLFFHIVSSVLCISLAAYGFCSHIITFLVFSGLELFIVQQRRWGFRVCVQVFEKCFILAFLKLLRGNTCAEVFQKHYCRKSFYFFFIFSFLFESSLSSCERTWLRTVSSSLDLNLVQYMFFIFLLILLEAAVTADVFLNRDWEEVKFKLTIN